MWPRCLAAIAYGLQLQGSDGTISERDLLSTLVDQLPEQWAGVGDDEAIARHQARDLIRALRATAGALIERAPARFGFATLGLQEYFAARRLVAAVKSRDADSATSTRSALG